MMDKNAYGLLSRLPPIRRSRGFRLYAQNGRRFLDFWQEGGAGILGSRAGRGISLIKDDLEAGRSCRLPSDGLKRLENAASRLFPGYRAILCYPDLAEAERRMAEAGIPESDRAVWAPFLPVPASRVLLVRPPLPESLRPAILLFERPSDALALVPGIPAAFQARAAVRALCDIRREETEGLPGRTRLWELFDSLAGPGLFARRGPYLLPAAPERYAETFVRFLDGGVLISPDPDIPSIIPGSFESGELSFLKEASR